MTWLVPADGTSVQVLLNFYVAGPFAWSGGETGQVGNEAAIVAQDQCRSQARPSFPSYIPPNTPSCIESGTLFVYRFDRFCFKLPA